MAHRFYYRIKPFVPWRVRMVARRFFAQRKRYANREIWPINPLAAQTPNDWPGWPDGRKTAFVITHDVEGPSGLEKCRQLAQLEMELGFRSSFNFIPEGEYRVTDSFRHWLNSQCFEVGVHDLHHDGKLYTSKSGFDAKANRINHYLRTWAASGFRSGFMLHQLEWLQALDITYDASTFDTDPFEPQPDGAGTIFPYWIPDRSDSYSAKPRQSRSMRGYVELPYTLPQDSTLFLLLREKTPEIWLRKTDWLVERGGMILVNVHPDYLRFEGERPNPRTFPIDHYRKLLLHIRDKYGDICWRPLPSELARWYATARTRSRVRPAPPAGAPAALSDEEVIPPAGLRGKRAAVLLYSCYPSDPRPRRAAEAMKSAGMEVDLLCLTEYDTDKQQEVVNGVNVYRLPMKRERGSKWNYLWLYTRFLFSSFWFLLSHGFRKRYDVVHVHNMPDFLIFAALLSKLRGAKLILDLHDPMPELMMTIYGFGAERRIVRILKMIERFSIACSDRVITVNLACKSIFSSRSCASEKVKVIMNSPDEKIFSHREPTQPPSASIPLDRPILMYHGSLVERHGLDLLVAAMPVIRQSFPGVELRLYGHETPYLHKVMDGIRGTDLENCVHYLGTRSLEGIAEAIRECHLGIIPNRSSLFTRINTPTRIFEYLSQGKPVVAPASPGIQDYFGPGDLIYFELGNGSDLAKQIVSALGDFEATFETVRRGQQIYLEHSWKRERARFYDLLAHLLSIELRAPSEPKSASQLAASGNPAR